MQNFTFKSEAGINPVKVYDDALLFKSEMIKDFKGKTIIYMWFNKVTGDVYVGSGWNGSNRIRSYFSISVLTSTKNSLIYNSLLKYGHNNFSFIILEEKIISKNPTDKKIYLERESFYIKWAIQTYNTKVMNILKIAGSSLGYVHSDYSKLKMSVSKQGSNNSMFNKMHLLSTKEAISLAMKAKIRRKHSDLTKEKISEAHKGKVVSQSTKDKISSTLKGRIFSIETKEKISASMANKSVSIKTRQLMSKSHSKPVLVRNIKTNEQTIYPSVKNTAESFSTTSTKIRNHIIKNSIMFDLYLISYYIDANK